MENSAVSDLARTLREYGDKILNSECKLTLSESLMRSLNSSFMLLNDQKDSMSSSFQVINSSNIKTNFFLDIQFLHDFLQRTSSLKIVCDNPPNNDLDSVDISIFKNVKLVEFYKVNVKKIKGIQALRAQIQFLVCRWILDTLSEILEKCGCDDSQGFIWSELKEASFSHNNISYLDNSLELVPLLNTIDLSHNNIKDAQSLSCLINLKHLNLSYNQLNAVPNFSGQICSRLQALILNNNFIDNLGSVVNLVNLSELDLSENCLIDHQSLLPLTYLSTLQWLNLKGNPLSFHPQHRIKTVCYLNSNTATVRFLLDQKALTKLESLNCGRIQPVHQSLQTESLFSSINNSTSVATERPRRVRTATISEGVDAVSEMDISAASVASLLMSNDHLETKRTIEQLRKQYGERWLQSGIAESSVQDVLGLEKSLPIMSSSPYEQLMSTYEPNYSQQNVTDGSELKSEESVNGTETYTTASETITHPNENGNDEKEPQPTTDDDYDADDDDEDVLGQGEENLYLVCPKGTTEPIFLVVTKTHIRERDCDSGKEKTRWPLDSLLACSTSGSDPVVMSLEFDTVRRDKKHREYDMVEEDAEKLSKHLSNILSIMETHKTRMVIFKCMKCGTRFGEERNSQKRGTTARVCPTPTCNSTLVIEDDDEQ